MLQINYSNKRTLERASAQSGTISISAEVTVDSNNNVKMYGNISDTEGSRYVNFTYEPYPGSEPTMSINGPTSLIEDAGTLLNEFITSVTAHYPGE